MSVKNLAPFLPNQPFMEHNQEAIDIVFADLKKDFGDRAITMPDGRVVTTAEALQFDNNGDLTPEASHYLLAVHITLSMVVKPKAEW